MQYYENDPRYKLIQTMASILETNTVEEISVSDIVNRCGVSRTTFYRYYNDKYALIAAVYEEFASTICQKSFEGDINSYELGLNLCKFIYSKKKFFKHAFAYNGQNSFESYLNNYSCKFWYERIMLHTGWKKIPDSIIALVKVYNFGSISFAREWTLGNCKEPSEFIADIIYKAIPPDLKRLID